MKAENLFALDVGVFLCFVDFRSLPRVMVLLTGIFFLATQLDSLPHVVLSESCRFQLNSLEEGISFVGDLLAVEISPVSWSLLVIL